jgi:hypothetical protein
LAAKGWSLWIPRFMYFEKYKCPPSTLQPMSGDIYCMTVWWDKTDSKFRYGRPSQFGICVQMDGAIKVLKMRSTKMVTAHSRKYGNFDIPQHGWRVPDEYEEWAKRHETTAQVMLGSMFRNLAYSVETAAWSMIRVSVENGGNHAVFSIDARRLPYFFSDRDFSLAESGLRKPIFHLVRPTVLKDGTVRRMHFRGQRNFTWVGYNVRITVPGRDHAMIEELPVGATAGEWINPKERRKFLDGAQLGKRLRSGMDELNLLKR